MSFGYSVGDIMAVSRLALKVYTAYKDAPNDYRNISDEVKSLHIIIEEATRHFDESTLLSTKKQQGGKEDFFFFFYIHLTPHSPIGMAGD